MDGKGSSEFSHIKHEKIRSLLAAQEARFPLIQKPPAKIALVDMTAGDGRGVLSPQTDLLRENYENYSPATPEILVTSRGRLVSCGYDIDVVLCEKGRALRPALTAWCQIHCPNAIVLPNHNSLLKFDFTPYAFAIIINDPNGPSWRIISSIEPA